MDYSITYSTFPVRGKRRDIKGISSANGTDFKLLMALAVLVNFSGLFVTIMGPDGALYASIAKTMAQHNDYIHLFAEGRDWLDKPHFPFWMAALSFQLFGYSGWAYKLPAVLFLMMGAVYTYRLAKLLYNEQVAWWATAILLTAEHIIISNTDVRAEPYLTGAIVASVYHFYRARSGTGYGQLAPGALFAAVAVMTKGPFAVIPIAGAIGGEMIIKRNWREVFHFRWMIATALTFLFILPELYCLYVQFDAHPGKTVFGRTGVSGIRFFFWDSQFGRFLNTGPIKGKGDPAFYLHTVLWAFLPWSVLLYAAVVNKIRKGWTRVAQTEWLTLAAALPCFVVFSLSRFQLPHYLNILFPFFAILTAQYVLNVRTEGGRKFIRIAQTVFTMLLPAAAMAIHLLFRPGQTLALLVLVIGGLVALARLRPMLKKNVSVQYLLVRTMVAAVLVNFYLNLVFYPALLKYQSGSEAAFVANRQFPGAKVVQLQTGEYNYALDFYLHSPLQTLQQLGDTSQLTGRPLLLFADVNAMAGSGLSPVQVFEHIHVSRLSIKQVNARTRPKDVQHVGLYLLRR